MTEQDVTTLDTNELIAQRRAKLKTLREQNKAYPNDFRRDTFVKKLHATYTDKSEAEFEAEPVHVSIAGRIMTRRLMGKASFVHLKDMSGRIQLYIKQDTVSPEVYENFLQWDLGDIIGVKGTLMKTKTGELSVRVVEIR